MYHCNYCNKDITGKICIKCTKCPDFDLCVECFSVRAEITPHKSNHPYSVMAIIMYGLGDWSEVAEHEGTKSKDQCIEHYNNIYLNSPYFPLPDLSHVVGRIERSFLPWLKGKVMAGKVHAHYNFGPLSAYLSINYLDRFLSYYELPGKAWRTQLLSVACLSLAAKMETEVPLSLDLQIFNESSSLRTPPLSRPLDLILNTIGRIDLLEFRPSEIAAAVALSISRGSNCLDAKEAFSSCTHIDDERALRCYEVIRDMAFISRPFKSASGSISSVPQSPVGVLDAACLSYKSDDVTVGSEAVSHHTSPDVKRRKIYKTICVMKALIFFSCGHLFMGMGVLSCCQ